MSDRGAQINAKGFVLIVVGEGVGSDAVCDIDGCGVWGIILVDTGKIFGACGGDTTQVWSASLFVLIMSWRKPGLRRFFDPNGAYTRAYLRGLSFDLSGLVRCKASRAILSHECIGIVVFDVGHIKSLRISDIID